MVGDSDGQDDSSCRRPPSPSTDDADTEPHKEPTAPLLRVICTCSRHP
jgi:hypothetical protein